MSILLTEIHPLVAVLIIAPLIFWAMVEIIKVFSLPKPAKMTPPTGKPNTSIPAPIEYRRAA